MFELFDDGRETPVDRLRAAVAAQPDTPLLTDPDRAVRSAWRRAVIYVYALAPQDYREASQEALAHPVCISDRVEANISATRLGAPSEIRHRASDLTHRQLCALTFAGALLMRHRGVDLDDALAKDFDHLTGESQWH